MGHSAALEERFRPSVNAIPTIPAKCECHSALLHHGTFLLRLRERKVDKPAGRSIRQAFEVRGRRDNRERQG